MAHNKHLKWLIWTILTAAAIIPVALAALSPFLAYRSLIYILAGFAGIITLVLFLLQPLLSISALPGLNPIRARQIHQKIGYLITLGVIIHIAGLYVTSPPDTLDALLLVSPTPFSLYGVIAMWALVFIVFFASLRKAFKKRAKLWKMIHSTASVILIIATIVHALQIQGAMEPVSKWILSIMVLIIALGSVYYLWRHKLEK